MILGTGVDIAEVPRIRESIERRAYSPVADGVNENGEPGCIGGAHDAV